MKENKNITIGNLDLLCTPKDIEHVHTNVENHVFLNIELFVFKLKNWLIKL